MVTVEPNVRKTDNIRTYGKFRIWMSKQHPTVRVTWKIAIAIAGVFVIVTGLILVPLPGPGWLIVFMGFAVLGLEFPAAHKVHTYIKAKAVALLNWWKARRAAKQKEQTKI